MITAITKDYCDLLKVRIMTEEIKKNCCDKDGKCRAQNIEEQKGCTYCDPMKTLHLGECVTLIDGNCVLSEALIAKWEELQREKKP
jgi:hypothetical protein